MHSTALSFRCRKSRSDLKAAPRPPFRPWHALTRGAGLALALVAGVPGAGSSASEAWRTAPLVTAELTDPTERYPHGVLGDSIEYGALVLQYPPDNARYVIRLPQTRVFEDIEARLVDVDGDGQLEAMVVESHQNKGARLSFYNGGGLIAATPYIGQRNRWLAPIGLADLDGDGHVEIGYIDRPHLAKTLRIWRFERGALRELAAHEGLTNHKIGWDVIASGIRECGDGPEMITADADWRHVIATRFDGKEISTRRIDTYESRASIAQALSCAH